VQRDSLREPKIEGVAGEGIKLSLMCTMDGEVELREREKRDEDGENTERKEEKLSGHAMSFSTTVQVNTIQYITNTKNAEIQINRVSLRSNPACIMCSCTFRKSVNGLDGILILCPVIDNLSQKIGTNFDILGVFSFRVVSC